MTRLEEIERTYCLDGIEVKKELTGRFGKGFFVTKCVKLVSMSGKPVFLGKCIGYGLPYATQYTNSQKTYRQHSGGYEILPQADPNGLFMPESAAGTYFGVKHENARRDVFEQSQSYYQGKKQELVRLRH